jgi:hypothetical protein
MPSLTVPVLDRNPFSTRNEDLPMATYAPNRPYQVLLAEFKPFFLRVILIPLMLKFPSACRPDAQGIGLCGSTHVWIATKPVLPSKRKKKMLYG